MEVERRKESISKSPLYKKEEVAEVPQLPVPMNTKSSKTADRNRKGLPPFIWVIGKVLEIAKQLYFCFRLQFQVLRFTIAYSIVRITEI